MPMTNKDVFHGRAMSTKSQNTDIYIIGSNLKLFIGMRCAG